MSEIAVVTEDASFLGIGRLVRPEPWRMDYHEHAFHEVVVVTRGGQTTSIGGARFRARPGDVLFYPVGEPHEEASEPGAVLDTFFFSFRWPSRPRGLPYAVKDADGRLRSLAGWLHEERHHPSRTGKETGDVLLRAFLLEFLRLTAGSGGLLEDVRGYALERLAEPLDLDTLARRAGMSRFHFLRTYKELSGLTPMEDVRRMRVERARDMILATALPLKEIAPAVGLGDVFHMSRLFRRYLDMTPASLRRRRPRGE